MTNVWYVCAIVANSNILDLNVWVKTLEITFNQYLYSYWSKCILSIIEFVVQYSSDLWIKFPHCQYVFYGSVTLHRIALTDAKRKEICGWKLSGDEKHFPLLLSWSLYGAHKTCKTHNERTINAHIPDERRTVNGLQRTSYGFVPHKTYTQLMKNWKNVIVRLTYVHPLHVR